MKVNVKGILLVVASFLLAFGFNTLDCMIWNFYYYPWLQWYPFLWSWTPSLLLPVWESYMFGGIFPLGVGAFLLGFMCAKVGTQK